MGTCRVNDQSIRRNHQNEKKHELLIDKILFSKRSKKGKFNKMKKDFGVSKLTMNFKINIFETISKYPKLKNSSIYFHFLKKYYKTIKETCKENASEFNQYSPSVNRCYTFLYGYFSVMKIYFCLELSIISDIYIKNLL